MIFMDVECRFCDGTGRIHSSGRNGDPMDPGEDCPKCDGTGVVQEDVDQSDDE